MRICTRSAIRLATLWSAGVIAAPMSAAAPSAQLPDHSIDARAELSEAMAKQILRSSPTPKVPRIQPDPAVAQSIENAAQHASSDPILRARASAHLASAKALMAGQSQAMSTRLHQALGLSAPPVSTMTQIASAGPARYVPLLFVSSSMPIDELRTYAAQIEKAGGALAFRGMPGGLHRVAPMAELSARILRLDPGCAGPGCRMRSVSIVVDPIAFRKAHVTAVPALAMVPADPTTPYCERDDGDTGPDILVSGDAALSGLLEEYARLGGKKEVADAQARLGSR